MRATILGVDVDAVTVSQAVEKTLSVLDKKQSAYICTPNPEILWLARKNEALQQALAGSFLTLADGVGVVWAAGYLGDPVPERVAGYDFLLALLAKLEGRVFLLGGQPGVAEQAAQTIEHTYPGVTVVGWKDGFFSQNAPVVEKINQCCPDVLLVCLGAPKQELWMAENQWALHVGVMVGLGGCLDVLAGRVRRAPDWWIDHKVEWLYRLLRQPKRLKRQIRLPLFVAAVLKQRMQDGKRKAHRSGGH
jgi:N-acetylglucosaminyldiphosphoundecaprenol N-acetyl-beta-D-mannosaminyltransferase